MTAILTPAPTVRPARRALSLATTILTVALFAVWLGWLRPAFLGGSTGYVIVSGTSMYPTLHNRDVVLVHKHDAYKQGDVIAYRIPKGDPGEGYQIIHRIIGGSPETGYITQGDNRASADQWRPKPADVIGSQAFHIPGAGKPFALLKTPIGIGAFAGFLTLVLLWGDEEKQRRKLSYRV